MPAQRISMRKILDILRLRWQNKLSYRQIAQKVFGDTKKYGTVRYILANTAYIGKLRQEKGNVVSIPRIISTQLFNKVQ